MKLSLKNYLSEGNTFMAEQNLKVLITLNIIH